MSAAWDMWFDRGEADMLANGARGIRLDELATLRREARAVRRELGEPEPPSLGYPSRYCMNPAATEGQCS